ncbi:polysaccharide pyruvyl transferase family protein [Vibrio breoganii]
MKIGILTYHDTFNAGAFLQTYATFKYLKDLGHDVEVIDYCPMSGYIKERKTKIKTKQPLLGLKSLLTKRHFLNKYLTLSKKRVVSNDFDKSKEILEGYDAVLVGADTVFEVKRDKVAFAPRIPNIYYFPETLKCRKIAFAASADASDFDLLDQEQRSYISSSLKDFHALSIRDSFTLSALEEIVPASYELIFDPTFMIDFPQIDIVKKLGLTDDFAILNIPNLELSQKFSDVFRKKGWKIVSPTRNKFADINLNGRVNPFEWAELYKHAKFTATDRFHGTIFSLKGNCPVVSVDSLSLYENQMSKKEDMLRRLKLESILMDFNKASNITSAELTQVVEQVIETWDIDFIHKQLQEAKKVSTKFLLKSLS